MAELGFGPSLNEIIEIVGDYSRANQLNHVFNEKKQVMTGPEVLCRHKLSLKKSGLVRIAQKNVTSDPFVIGIWILLSAAG